MAPARYIERANARPQITTYSVEYIRAPETVQRALSLIRVGILLRLISLILFAFVADHRSENENAFFATPDEAAKRSPSAVSLCA